MRDFSAAVGKALQERGATISCAESCTGGLLSSLLTDVEGSSAYMKGAVVAYSNEVKEKLLGVKHETLEQYGAVSEQTAREMARGAAKLMGTDIGVGITGIAGPGGGSEEKPVGRVYIAVAGSQGEQVRANDFPGSRYDVKLQTASTALRMLVDYYTL
ncbi:MAG: nicotinamide-nucleotide amidohydrolase family protein [Selenomonas sp.]|nr:nicotinamide-nucleotide amidohydrolase family protein [Selenomonas sp.]